MLLSEMFGVELDTEFGVEGYSVTFKIATFLEEYEYLMYRWSDRLDWREAEQTLLCGVIAAAPSGIIHLPPPLTDEQWEQLKALYTLGYKWLAKDFDYQVYAHAGSKPSKSDEEWRNDCDCFIRIHDGLPESAIKSLVSWSDPEPYDIGKALGVGE